MDNKQIYVGIFELVDKLNELSEENERLQKENSILNRNEDDLKECTLENIHLKEENEQLRKKLEQIYGFKGLNCRCVR